jgi:hypothetical protein
LTTYNPGTSTTGTTPNGLDPRLLRITIDVNGVPRQFENLYISAVGVKYANPLMDECEITIYNLDKATRDYILTETSPYNRNRQIKKITVEAGRVSYGYFVVFTGNVIYSAVTQPPDVGVVLRCLTGVAFNSDIFTVNQPATTTAEEIANAIAQDLDVYLQFQATNKEVNNYAYTGSALQQIAALASLGQYNVFLDGESLIMKDPNTYNGHGRGSGIYRNGC